MMNRNPYAKYKESSTTTSSKEELTLMLYEGALKFSNQAVAAIESNDAKRAHELIIKVQDIIQEFRVTLNKKYEIAFEFDRLYEYIIRRLVEANIKKDAEIMKEVRDLIRDFRDTWKEAMIIAKKVR